MRTLWTLVLLAVLTSTACSWSSREPESTGRQQEPGRPPLPADVDYAEPTRPPTQWALLVGINEYRNRSRVSSLAGCVNDVAMMRGVLIGKYSFPEDHILVLTNDQATHEGIVQAFRNHLMHNAERDDIVVFHYSGHGSQMRDTSGDEADGWDETLVPNDSRDPEGKVFDISDDELNELFLELQQKTRNVTFILDSCNSGTALRAAGNVRRIAPDDRTPPPAVPGSPTRGIGEGDIDWRPSSLNYTLISGCRAGESSFEHFADDEEHGALTWFLAQELRTASPEATFRDVMDIVEAKVNARYPSQHPQLEGTDSDKLVFGDTAVLPEPFVLCSPRSGQQVELQVGRVQGATEGSTYEIYPPGTKTFEGSGARLATCRITEAGAFDSRAELLSPVSIPASSRCVEREHRYPEFRLRVHFDGLRDSAVLQSVRQELEHYDHIEFKLQPRDYHVLFRREGGELIMEGGDETEIAPRTAVDDPNAATVLVRRTLDWAKWFNVLSVENPSPELDVRLTVSPAEGAGGRGTPFQRVGAAALVLRDGERFDCRVDNHSSQGVYVSILDLSTDGSVTVVYPPAGAAEILAAGGQWSRRLNSFVPEGRQSVKDVLKVFATTTPVDFRFLQKDPVRGGVMPDELTRGAATPLRQLLASVALGTTRNVSSAVPLGDWTTAEQIIEVRRQ